MTTNSESPERSTANGFCFLMLYCQWMSHQINKIRFVPTATANDAYNK